ncbi:MAG: PAS domain S-box protein, partial [Actinobacteria bacterium]|nr:PAS domain S-box protein [Actinomycetota bacterium]
MKKVTWKQRLEHIVSIITEGIIVFDRDGRITFANAEAEKILGLKRSTIIGRTFNDPAWKFTTVDGRPLPDDEHPFAWVMQTGRGIYGMELAVERPDGTEVPLSVNAGPLRDEKGTTDVVVSFLDVTEQKRAKSALRDSEERFHRCLDLSPESVTIYREGKIIYMNAAGAKLLGAKNPEEFIGKPVLSLIHPDYHEVMKDRVQQVQQGKVVGLVEEKFLSLDGRIIDVEVTVAPIIYQGKMAMLLVAHDITERKRAEERLRLFSEAVEGAPDGVQITDLNGYILYSNRAVERIYGYTPEEYRGRHVNEMNVDLEFASNVILPSIKET